MKKNKQLDWSSARDVLRVHREHNVRKSQKVIDIWESVLQENVSKLGDEKFLVFEQVYICALDCHRMDIANHCLQSLAKSFPNSCRVRLLQGLMLEALDRFDEALELLEAVIADDETNASPRKRKIAILKSKGKIPEAIKELNDYLKKFVIDQDAWNELCNLYLSEQEFAKAAFCMEELILQNPHNHLYYQRFAEIKYTQGGTENMELAMSNYFHALKLCSSNMRALYGLFLCAKHISNSAKCTHIKRKKMEDIIDVTLQHIQTLYTEASSKNISPDELEDTFGSLHVTDSE